MLIILFFKRTGSEEIQLVWALDGKGIDDDIPLRALITLNRIDTDSFQLGNV